MRMIGAPFYYDSCVLFVLLHGACSFCGTLFSATRTDIHVRISLVQANPLGECTDAFLLYFKRFLLFFRLRKGTKRTVLRRQTALHEHVSAPPAHPTK
jgi:hypothetical protein